MFDLYLRMIDPFLTLMLWTLHWYGAAYVHKYDVQPVSLFRGGPPWSGFSSLSAVDAGEAYKRAAMPQKIAKS